MSARSVIVRICDEWEITSTYIPSMEGVNEYLYTEGRNPSGIYMENRLGAVGFAFDFGRRTRWDWDLNPGGRRPSAFKADAIVHSAIPPHLDFSPHAYKNCRLPLYRQPVVAGRDGEVALFDPRREVWGNDRVGPPSCSNRNNDVSQIHGCFEVWLGF